MAPQLCGEQLFPPDKTHWFFEDFTMFFFTVVTLQCVHPYIYCTNFDSCRVILASGCTQHT